MKYVCFLNAGVFSILSILGEFNIVIIEDWRLCLLWAISVILILFGLVFAKIDKDTDKKIAEYEREIYRRDKELLDIKSSLNDCANLLHALNTEIEEAKPVITMDSLTDLVDDIYKKRV